MNRLILLIAIHCMIISCASPPADQSPQQNLVDMPRLDIDIQGHRGARGLMPENTIPGFIKALDIGVTTLELDVVISQDSLVVLSHEPIMSAEICLDGEGNELGEEERNMFQMTYEEIKAFDCGTKVHSRFPNQEKRQAYKPLLAEVIDTVEAYVNAQNIPPPFYNIETKSQPEGDNIYHPEPSAFVDLLLEVVREKEISERVTIQSFDPRTLRAANTSHKDIRLVLLIENERSPDENLATLGFTPSVYSPYFQLVDERLIQLSREEGMDVIPWTVNKRVDILSMLRMGVDGIISDYPDSVQLVVNDSLSRLQHR
ncbi:MAG: glycerophosphodiester phosphodiesterase family protein [Bacteroidota bacterium]